MHLTESELQAFATFVFQLAFAGGVLGACCWSLFMAFIAWAADAVCSWEERRNRIGAARARATVRHINGGRLG